MSMSLKEFKKRLGNVRGNKYRPAKGKKVNLKRALQGKRS